MFQKDSAFPPSSPFYATPGELPPTPPAAPAQQSDETAMRQQGAAVDQLRYALDDAFWALESGDAREAKYWIEQAKYHLQGLSQ